MTTSPDTPPDARPLVVAVVPDLFFGVRVQDNLTRAGYRVRLVRQPADWPSARADAPRLLIVDLGSRQLPWDAWVREWQGDPATSDRPVLAFGSHLDFELRARAKRAGCTRVLANSKFNREMVPLVEQYAADSPPAPDSAEAEGDEEA